MGVKTIGPLAAALVLASLTHSAVAETLGEHPAVLVARTWSTRGIDPNTFIVAHPARLGLLAASPTERNKGTREQSQCAAHASAHRR
ncbi:MAG: hypothetical protein ACRETT_13680 [Steroidobacteraceae bacterium]